MSSPSMNCVQSTGNADQVETTVPESGVQLNGTTRHATERPVGRSHDNGFRFGPGNWANSPSKPEINTNRIVPGKSIADVGFELLAHDGTFVAWFLCPIDACDAMKLREGPGKIVRCSDRALIKVRYPRRRKGQ